MVKRFLFKVKPYFLVLDTPIVVSEETTVFLFLFYYQYVATWLPSPVPVPTSNQEHLKRRSECVQISVCRSDQLLYKTGKGLSYYLIVNAI